MSAETAVFADLRDLRERLVRLRAQTVAELSGIGLHRLRNLEAGVEASVYEFERLAEVYGIDADALWEQPIRLSSGDGVEVLASLDEFQEIDDLTRARVIRAASAARDLVSLRRLLSDAIDPLPALRADLRVAPYQQGAGLARELRAELGLGVGAVPSVRDLIAQRIPGVSTLYADFGTRGPAGLGFADRVRGPAVVLNVRGKNENPAVRRFSHAHELCHLLADWNRADPLVSISGYLSEKGMEREQRANGFAVRFLCPETVVHRLQKYRDVDAARVLVEEYGLHYRAARLYLQNEAKIYLPTDPPAELRRVLDPDPTLERSEGPRAVNSFPLPEAPCERRGVLAEAVVRAWARGLISRDECARLMGVTPVASIERVADFFDLDLPDELLSAG